MQKFQNRKEKSARKMLVKDVWHSLVKNMCLLSNALKDNEMVKSYLFIPQKRKLIANKGRDGKEQESHIQKKKIRLKLSSVIRFL